MNILGISAFYHDSAACLVRDGRIVAAAEEERFTRTKHDHRFPRHAISYCLKQAGITAEQLSHVAFYDKPWAKFERLLETYLASAPGGLISFFKSMPLWLRQRLWMDDLIKKEIGYGGVVTYPEHHQSHAASAFFPSPFDRAAIITVDGVGEWATASWGIGAGNKIELKYELRFPHSLGLLYSAFTYYLGFKVNSGEYKVMGLAPYGQPKYARQIVEEVMDLRDDGSFRLNMKYFNYCSGLTMTSNAFHRLFGGPPRKPESALTQRDMDLARSVQEVTEEVMSRVARHVRRVTGERRLCMAGGVALNCVSNGRIHREKIYDDLWIQPAASDAGGALGAALFVWNQVLGNHRIIDSDDDSLSGSYLGPAYSAEEIEAWLNQEHIPHERLEACRIPGVAARFVADGLVVGWFSGRMEFGPRALGSRSILADPRSVEMQSIMNLKIKFRESFRPFAPSCLPEDASEFFELDGPSPYMMLVATVRPERRLKTTVEQNGLFGLDKLRVPRSELPAVTHVDYSARVHTVDHRRAPQFYRLIEELKTLTGYGVVVNTSFNVRGEPIVCTPNDAYQCFMRTEMDALILEDCILHKKPQPALREATSWQGVRELD
jgi:carbamoyltransferase